MTDTTPHDAQSLAAAATERDTLTHVIAGPDGNQYEIVVTEPTLDELEDLERAEASGELSETEAERQLWDEYLVEPDLDYGAVGTSWVQPVTTGIMEAFMGGDDLEDALAAVGGGEDAPGN